MERYDPSKLGFGSSIPAVPLVQGVWAHEMVQATKAKTDSK